MGMRLWTSYHHNQLMPQPALSSSTSAYSGSSISLLCFYRRINASKISTEQSKAFRLGRSTGFKSVAGRVRVRRRELCIVASSSNVAAPLWDSWKPEKGSEAPPLSDVVWPSAGAFAAMAIMGKMDQILAAKGLSMTIAPFGAVCAVLFAASSSPAARKYNVFMAQIGCAAIGVLAFSILGPGWLARSAGLAAAIAFMIYTRSVHPPAASLPLLFIDGAKLHHLNFWYALFPGAIGCILLCLINWPIPNNISHSQAHSVRRWFWTDENESLQPATDAV